MYFLLKRKDDLGSVVSVEDHDEAGLQTFVSEWDLVKKCVAVRALL